MSLGSADPTFRLPVSVMIRNPDKVCDRIDDQCVDLRTRRPAEVTADSRSRALREFSRERPEPGAVADLPDHPLCGLANCGLIIWGINGQEDLRHPKFVLTMGGLEASDHLGNLVIADDHARTEPPAYQLLPSDAGFELV